MWRGNLPWGYCQRTSSEQGLELVPALTLVYFLSLLLFAKVLYSAIHAYRRYNAFCQLEFPDNFFDLVNVRLATGWLRTWDWLKFLEECRRVCCSGSVVRITEGTMEPRTTSVVLTRLLSLYYNAHYQSGIFLRQRVIRHKRVAQLVGTLPFPGYTITRV